MEPITAKKPGPGRSGVLIGPFAELVPLNDFVFTKRQEVCSVKTNYQNTVEQTIKADLPIIQIICHYSTSVF